MKVNQIDEGIFTSLVIIVMLDDQSGIWGHFVCVFNVL